MNESHIVIVGQYAGKAKGESALAVPGEDFDPRIKATLRGPYPNYGSGPWFCATKVGKITYTNGSFQPGWGKESGGYVGLSTFEGTSFLLRATTYNRKFRILMAIEVKPGSFFTKPDGSMYLRVFRRGGNIPAQYQEEVEPGDYEGWLSAAMSYLGSVNWDITDNLVKYQSGAWGPAVKSVTGFEKPKFHFKFNEMEKFQWAAEFGILVDGSASRWSSAYANAVQSLDTAQVNTLANIIQAAEGLVTFGRAVRDIFHGDWGKIVRDLKRSADPRNLWLSYRYVYKTTELDIKEYAKMLQRLGDLATITGDISSSGSFSDETGFYMVKIRLGIEQVVPKNTVEFLAAIGVEPNAQNIWDLIPYSFVVDWFFHISDLMEWVDRWGNAIDLPIKECWCIYKSAYESQQVYYRVPGRRPNIPPIYVSKEASSRTVKMRIADSISLFT